MEKSEEKANSEPENVADNLGEKTNSVWGENDDFVQGNFGDKLSESESVESEANSGGDSISKKEQPSELDQIESFKFNPIRINSDLVGQTISDVFDEAKKGIVKAVYEFKTRFYADVEWCNGNFEEYYSFSHYRKHITQKDDNL